MLHDQKDRCATWESMYRTHMPPIKLRTQVSHLPLGMKKENPKYKKGNDL